MSVREIPRSFHYTCDNCDQVHRQENAGGHYTNSIPPEWSRLRFILSSDADVSLGSDRDMLLCDDCTKIAAHQFMRVFPEGKKP